MRRFLLLCLLWLIGSSAASAQSGIFIRSGTSSITNPIIGQTYCFDYSTTVPVLRSYNIFGWTILSNPFSNYSASTAPTVSNDNTEGYQVGSIWIDTTHDISYVCAGANTGAAAWLQQGTSSSGTVTQINTGTGLSGGPITTTGTISLANTAVTAGSYTNANITVNAQGQITAAANGSGGDVASVSNSDGTLTISPTTGSVVASLAALTSGDILVGNTSNVATGVPMSGDATLSNAGTITLKTVNSNVGTYQGLTVNAKGLVTAATNENYLTANQTITLSGDVSGSGTTAITTTLATVNNDTSSVGSSTSIPTITANAKGLVTSVTGNPVVAPAGTLTGTTLASNVVSSSLTSLGTITSGTWEGAVIGSAYIPTPTTSTIGGVEAITAVSHEWISSINTSGVPQLSQPAFSDISGSASASQMPAFSGDISTSAGSTVTTLATVNSDVGTYTNATITVNAKGLVTAASSGSSGSGTVDSGTGGQITYYASTGTTVSGNADATISSGQLTLGQSGTAGSIVLNGSTSGTVTLGVSAAAGAGTVFNLPSSNGTNGYVLQTDGSGNTSWHASSGGGGTVTSVALSDGSTAPIYGISGSPITDSGTLTFTLDTQSANTIFAGPSSGSAAQPGFRALVLADLPSGTGTVTSIATNSGLTGGTITTSGTIGLAGIAQNTVLGSITTGTTTPVALTATQLTTIPNLATASLQGMLPALTDAQIVVGKTSSAVQAVAMSGDAIIDDTGALTVTKTNGTAFAASATTDTTDASNITSGTLGAGEMPALTGDVTTIAGHVATTIKTSVALAGSPTTTTQTALTDNTTIATTAYVDSAVAVGGGGVTSFTGDGTLVTNSGSTGAVTVTLGTALPSTILGSSLTSLGTIATGVWNGTRLTSSYIPTDTAYNDAANSWSTAQLPGTAGAIDLGSTAKPWRTIYGTDTTDTTYYYKILPQALSGNRTVNVPDANSTTVQANAGTTHQWVSALSGTTGALTTTQPAYSDISGAPTVNSGTSGELAYYSASSATISAAADTSISSGALTLGTSGPVAGSIVLYGGTSGTCTISVPAVAGTGTAFTLPSTNGTNTYALTTNGSGVTSWNQISLTAAVTGTLPLGNGGTGQTAFSTPGFVLSSGSALSSAAITICRDMVFIGTLTNTTYLIQVYAPFGYTITGVDGIQTTSGTCTAKFEIGSTAITGLGSISVTSSPQNVSASAANTVVSGNSVSIVISSVSSASGLQFTLVATRTQ